MIVKFLKASATFEGVRYNTNKAENDKGELMKVSGFGPLQAYQQLRPEDYVNYLEMISARNKRIRYPQLHAIISAKGQSSTKEELTDIASKWLKEMGYKGQPYLIMFHKDTKNSHVHIVSTRVDKTSGKKISSAYEKIRGLTAINKVLKQDEHLVSKADLAKAMAYNFSTKAQFMLILESQGYTIRENGGKLELIKFGRKLLDIDLSLVKQQIGNSVKDETRAIQLTAILQKYRLQYSGKLNEETTGLAVGLEKGNASYTSDLSVYLKEKFGIRLIFHGKIGMPAYGYTIIDHKQSGVYKGGEILDLAELFAEVALVPSISPYRTELTDSFSTPELINHDGPLTQKGSFSPAQTYIPHEAPVNISISDDIDDEEINGRNRKRKRKARTNSR